MTAGHRSPLPEPADPPEAPASPAHASTAPALGSSVSSSAPAVTPAPAVTAAPAVTTAPAPAVTPAAGAAARAALPQLPAGGLAQAGRDDFSFAAAVGGPRGVVEALAPGLLFVVVFSVTRDLQMSLTVAVGAAVLAVLARAGTRSNPTQALSGVVGVAVCAVFAARSGDARDFYVPGFLTNVAYGSVYLASTIPFRRFRLPLTTVHVGPGPFPVIGLVVGPLTGEGLSWRRDPRRLRAYQRVTWLWVGLFGARLVVQLPLYYADAVGALGVARLVMGVPLFATVAWLTWMVLRNVPVAAPDEPSPVTLRKG